MRTPGKVPALAAALLAALSSTPVAAQPGPGADEAAVVATVQTLFDALEARDGDLLRSVVAPDLVMQFAETRDGATVYGSATVDALVERIEGSPVPLVERMWDPVVTVEGHLATLWAPYDFYAGSEWSHCGVDAATLLRRADGSWEIVGLSWTREQPPTCERHPDGPPGR